MAVNNSDYDKQMRFLRNILRYDPSQQNRSFLREVGVLTWKGFKEMFPPHELHSQYEEIKSLDSTVTIDTDGVSLSTFNRIINGYTVTFVASFGLILNLVGILFLLTGSRREKLFNLLLSTLLVFDTLFLLFGISRSVQNHFVSTPARYLKLYYILVNGGMRFSMTASIIMLVGLSHVRLCAIKNPFKYNGVNASWKTRRKYLLTYCIPILLSSFIFALPVVWEVEDVLDDVDGIRRKLVPSSLRLNIYYSLFYIGVLNLGIMGILPIGGLTYLTYQLIVETKKNSHRLNMMEKHLRDRSLSNERKRAKQDAKLTKGLVSIVIAFMVLHMLRVITTLGELVILLNPNKNNYFLQLGYGIPAWLKITASVSELFMIIYSSVNVVIYIKADLHKFPITKFKYFKRSSSQRSAKGLNRNVIHNFTSLPFLASKAVCTEKNILISNYNARNITYNDNEPQIITGLLFRPVLPSAEISLTRQMSLPRIVGKVSFDAEVAHTEPSTDIRDDSECPNVIHPLTSLPLLASKAVCTEENILISNYNAQHSSTDHATNRIDDSDVPQVIIHRADSPTLPFTEMFILDTPEICIKRRNYNARDLSNDPAANNTNTNDSPKVIIHRADSPTLPSMKTLTSDTPEACIGKHSYNARGPSNNLAINSVDDKDVAQPIIHPLKSRTIPPIEIPALAHPETYIRRCRYSSNDLFTNSKLYNGILE